MPWRRVLASAALALAALTALPAGAQERGDWIVRIRALHLDSADHDDTPLDLSIEDRWFPEIDFSYFFTRNWAAELVLTYPQRHDVRAGGPRIGSLKHLPPTLSLQYHVTGLAGWRPYAGAGVNYTRFSSVDLPAGVSIDRHSVARRWAGEPTCRSAAAGSSMSTPSASGSTRKCVRAAASSAISASIPGC